MSRGKKVFVYKKLWDLMKEKGVTKSDLRNNGILAPATIAKLGRNEKVSIDVIDTLCTHFQCQPGDIMDHIPDKDMHELKEKVRELEKMITQLKDIGNFSDDDIEKIAKALNSGKSVLELEELFYSGDE